MRKILSTWNPLKGQDRIVLRDQTCHKDRKDLLEDKVEKRKLIKVMLMSLKKGFKLREKFKKRM